jgi:hypothetical protein
LIDAAVLSTIFELNRASLCTSLHVIGLKDIGPYWFRSDGEDERNNEEIIALSDEIDKLLSMNPERT